MFCRKCGQQVDDNALFCRNCGEKTAKAIQAESPAPENTVQQAAPSASPKPAFDLNKAIAAANNGIEALKSDKKLLLIAGGVLALVLIIIIVIVTAALGGKKSQGGVTIPGVEGTFYFDQPLAMDQIVEFGSYEQDGNALNGKEPIKWKVVSVENNRYLLVAHNVLDCQPFDNGSGSSASGGLEHGSNFLYEDSSLRQWMNNTFSAQAFGEEERKYIIPVSFRNDVMTATEGNQFATDYAFILNSDEVERYMSSMLQWKKCSPPTAYAMSQGATTIPVQEIMDNDPIWNGSDYPETEESRLTVAGSLFGTSMTDYFDIGYISPWYIRDVEGSQAFYTGAGGGYLSVNMDVKNGVRPAIYISADACYVKQVDESQGSAIEKMSEYKGVYRGPQGWESDNTIDMTISQGFFTIESIWIPRSDNEDLWFVLYNQLDQYLLGRYNMSDFEYTVENGNDCFTDYNRGVRFIYDKRNDKWQWYLNYPEGTNGLPAGKGGQWLLYFELVPEDKYVSGKQR